MAEKFLNDSNYKMPSSLNSFQQDLYIHLINWKWEHITKEPVSFKVKKKGEESTYESDAIIPESKSGSFPTIYPPIKTHFINHQKKYFTLHKHFHHMASSQAANINLFLPILYSKQPHKILCQINPGIKTIAQE